MDYYGWRPYVSVAKRRANAVREMKKLRQKGSKIEPVVIEGRKIVRTFWGEAWCNHLQQFSDFANRLPRGRTYVRNGSVCHLAIEKGKISAIVSGSELYHVEVKITPLTANKWKRLRKQCSGQIGSMLELLQGRFSDNVMGIVTDRHQGLFPQPKEIKLSCDCPDWAVMCKHVAAVLFGIGARLDQQPELLFLLRNVEHEQLINAELDVLTATSGTGKRRRLDNQNLSELFGVAIDGSHGRGRSKKPTVKKSAGATAMVNKKNTNQSVRKSNGHGKNKLPNMPVKAAKKKAFTPTAAAIHQLRKRFCMHQSQFAKLLGVSPPTVSNWENGSGKLNLRQHTMKALNEAAKLSSVQATRRLRRYR